MYIYICAYVSELLWVYFSICSRSSTISLKSSLQIAWPAGNLMTLGVEAWDNGIFDGDSEKCGGESRLSRNIARAVLNLWGGLSKIVSNAMVLELAGTDATNWCCAGTATATGQSLSSPGTSRYLYVYRLIKIYIYTYIYICFGIYVYIYTYTHTYVYIYIYIYVLCVYICTRCIYMSMRMHMYLYVSIYVYVISRCTHAWWLMVAYVHTHKHHFIHV